MSASNPPVEPAAEGAPGPASPAEAGVTTTTREMTIPEALQLAAGVHRAGDLPRARSLFIQVLQLVPDHPDALGFLGVLEHQDGRGEAGVALLRRACDLAPEFAGHRINLGNVLMEQGRLAEASSAYEQALALEPHRADLHNNLAALHRAQGNHDQAIACYERAVEIDPRHVRAWNNLGLLHDALGQRDLAMKAYVKAMECGQLGSAAPRLVAMALHRAGEVERAQEVLRHWAALEPDNPVAAHFVAAVAGHAAPARASDAYIAAEFDGFAGNFERVLNGQLNYRAPELCGDLLARHLPPPEARLDVLDIGCGTGLCGPLLAPWAHRLVGVDLSAGMLTKARSKGVYTELVQGELTAYLGTRADAWDVIVCADTLCYFGSLFEVMRAAASALRPGAPMAFTVEALDDDAALDPVLQFNGRYAHGRAHLDRAIEAAGLTRLQARREVLRHEGGDPVPGWLVAVQRPH